MTVGYSALPNRQRITCTRGRLTSSLIDECSAAPSLVCGCPLVAQYGDWQWVHSLNHFDSFATVYPLLSHVTRVTYINRRLQAQYIARLISRKGSMPNYVCLKLKLIYTQYQSRRPYQSESPEAGPNSYVGTHGRLVSLVAARLTNPLV